MATYRSAQVAAGQVFSGIAPANQVQTVCGIFNITTALAQNDVVKLVTLPAGATVVGGYLQAVDIDTGTEALDIDVGWSANPDGFGNLGVWTGDAVSGFKPDTGNLFNLGGELFVGGPVSFTAATDIELVCNAAANAGGTGKVWIVVHFIMG